MNPFFFMTITCSTIWAAADAGTKGTVLSTIWLVFALIVWFDELRKNRALAAKGEK